MEKKVVLLGLDNAGKTSFIKALDKNYDDIQKLSPTIKIERSEIKLLDFSIVRWDCGGQEKYRKEYLAEESKVLVDADYIMYFIDITDEHRYDEAIDYLIDILEAYKLMGWTPPFVICLHKADPAFIDIVPGKKKMLPRWEFKEKINILIDRLKKILSGLDISIYLTSIYDRNSILIAFTHVLKSFISESEIINLVKLALNEFITKNNLIAASIMERSTMLFAEVITNSEIKDIFNAIMTNGLNLYENIQVVKPFFKMTLGLENYKFMIAKFIKDKKEYFFTIMGKSETDLNQSINDFEENFIDRIYNLLK